jgi:hypothetical protein
MTLLCGRMTDERRIVKDFVGSGRGLIEVLSRQLPGGIVENQKISQSR